MLKFTSVKWKNFLSYGNYWTEIQLDATHTTILLGESGSGKSTLLDVLSFVLFNKPFRNINKPQIVNSLNQKDCVVEVKFQIGNKAYTIVRGIKPGIFEIYCDGTLINQDANLRDYQGYLEEKILGFNFKSFKQIVVLGAANFTPFMQLRTQERRIIIEELLDIEVFGNMNLILKQRMSQIRQSIESCESEIRLLQEKKKLHDKYMKDLVQNRKEKIEKNESKIEDYQKQIEELNGSIDAINKEIEIKRQHLNQDETIRKQKKKIEDLEHKLRNSVSKLDKDVSFFESNDKCPTCKQSISADWKEEEILKKKTKIDELEDGISKTQEKHADVSKKIDFIEEVKKSMQELAREVAIHENSISSMEKYIGDITKEITDLKTSKKNITEERKQLASIKKELTEIESDIQEYVNARVVHETASDLLKDGGVKSRIIKQYLPLINKHTNKFLSVMNFFASFHINENFQESIKSRGHDEFSYGNFSAGEQQRIDLALLFTWRIIAKMKNSVNTNLLIMDEVFDSYLDIEATENAIEVLNGPFFKHSNIFVISHKNTIGDKFHRKLSFIKKKNFSFMESD